MADVEPPEAFATEAGELFERHLLAFAEFIAAQWTLQPKDAEECGLSEVELNGWNKCCASIPGAAKDWAEGHLG